jgi:hypothetical protein
MAGLVISACGNGDVDAGVAAHQSTPGTGLAPTELAAVNLATRAYQDVAAAEAAGYEAFLDCFDDPATGGMGQHHVDTTRLDDTVEATAPEAMVYEVTATGLVAGAVEWIVPADLVDPDAPPELFGRPFHLNEELDVWVLHAWIWKDNPLGMFEDWNPKVRPCPAEAAEEPASTSPDAGAGGGGTADTPTPSFDHGRVR